MLRAAFIAASLLLAGAPAWAQTPNLPELWRVGPLHESDRIHLRKGPGTSYPIVGHLAADSAGLERDSCVLLTFNKDEAVANRPQWCLISQSGRELGWVAARYLVPEGLVFLRGFRNPTDACRLIGESPGTVDFLDHTASLIGCPEGHRDIEGFLNFGATELARIAGYTLLSVPRP